MKPPEPQERFFDLTFSLPEKRLASDLWFVFQGERLLVRDTGAGISVPVYSDFGEMKETLPNGQFLGRLGGTACYLGEVGEDPSIAEAGTFMEMRPLLGLLDEDMFSMAGRAFQILHWRRTHRFCSRCGGPTEPKTDERARVCPRCGLVIFPEVSPAIIVAVVKGDEILLGQSPRFKTGFYSVLAGFVEPGETFEQCVRREVMEEAGIEVGEIRYFGSQPWPFPHSLMVGFTAVHKAGKIRIDNSELTDAGWYKAADLPSIPAKGTIARRLIDWFIEKHGRPGQAPG